MRASTEVTFQELGWCRRGPATLTIHKFHTGYQYGGVCSVTIQSNCIFHLEKKLEEIRVKVTATL